MTVHPPAPPICAGTGWSGCGACVPISRRRVFRAEVVAAGLLRKRGAFCTTAPGECLNGGLSRQKAQAQLQGNFGSILLPVAPGDIREFTDIGTEANEARTLSSWRARARILDRPLEPGEREVEAEW